MPRLTLSILLALSFVLAPFTAASHARSRIITSAEIVSSELQTELLQEAADASFLAALAADFELWTVIIAPEKPTMEAESCAPVVGFFVWGLMPRPPPLDAKTRARAFDLEDDVYAELQAFLTQNPPLGYGLFRADLTTGTPELMFWDPDGLTERGMLPSSHIQALQLTGDLFGRDPAETARVIRIVQEASKVNPEETRAFLKGAAMGVGFVLVIATLPVSGTTLLIVGGGIAIAGGSYSAYQRAEAGQTGTEIYSGGVLDGTGLNFVYGSFANTDYPTGQPLGLSDLELAERQGFVIGGFAGGPLYSGARQSFISVLPRTARYHYLAIELSEMLSANLSRTAITAEEMALFEWASRPKPTLISKDEQFAVSYLLDASNRGGNHYDPRTIRAELETRYGVDNVTSTTVPPPNARNIGGTNSRAASGVVYDTRGFPIFDEFVAIDLRISATDVAVRNRGAHMRAATRELRGFIESGAVSRGQFNAAQLRAIQGGRAKIPGFTWHHHQNVGRMQLVPTRIHESAGTPHIGGFQMWYGR